VFKLIGVFIICLTANLSHAASADWGAGLRFIHLKDPVTHTMMSAAVFYPTKAITGSTAIGPLEIAAVQDAPLRQGRYPLVLLSHGNAASMLSQHDIASALAKRGFVVAAIEHPGDNFRDESGLGTDRVWVGRNLQLIALLDFLLAHPDFAQQLDPTQIGVAGFSAGAYTALLMIGAKPKFDLLQTYCERHKSVLCSHNSRVRVSSPPFTVQADARVRAAFIMSPVGAFFDSTSLSDIKAPVYIYAAANDSILPIQSNVLPLHKALQTIVNYSEIPGADHFIFLSPCTAKMKAITPKLCTDPQGVDRVEIHQKLIVDAADFFREYLR
jgi:predicted dienelactone hydrolase